MATTLLGRTNWNLTIDKDGHRDYMIQWKVATDDPLDGPGTIHFTPDLPTIGATWTFGNDNDPWAFRWPTERITPVIDKEKQCFWIVEHLFTTRPLNRCQDTSIENPLLEPDRLSGSFVRFTKEAVEDKDGRLLKSSSHERFRGAVVEIDDNRPTVTIEKNILILPLALASSQVDTLNDAPLWGLNVRMVKLSNVSWQRVLFGVCGFFFIVSYEFDIDFATFDRRIPDEGTKRLNPDNPAADPSNPDDFVIYKDANEENAGPTKALLDGAGQVLTNDADVFYHEFKIYKESNFFLLGIPAALV